jgi:S-DNA-T family DNA segregation ATPase FtsK/SpoIIIE
MPRKRSPKHQSRIPTGAARQAVAHPHRSHEIGGIVALGLSIFFVASLVSLQLGSGRLMGPLGRSVASAGYGLLGSCAYLVAGGVTAAALRLLLDQRPVIKGRELASAVLGVGSLAILLHLSLADYRVAGHAPGGLVGEHLAEVSRALLSTAGTALLGCVGLTVAVVIATPFRMRQVLDVVFAGSRGVLAALRRAGAVVATWTVAGACGFARALADAAVQVIAFCGEVIAAILPERDPDDYAEYEVDEDPDPLAVDEAVVAAVDPPILGSLSGRIATPLGADDDDTARMEGPAAAHGGEAEAPARATRRRGRNAKASTLPGVAAGVAPLPAAVVVEAQPSEPVDAPVDDDSVLQPAASQALPLAASAGGDAAPEIVESQFRKQGAQEMARREQALEAERKGFIQYGEGEFQLPPIGLLRYDASDQGGVDKLTMLEVSARLTKALSEYGVKGEVTAIRPGPVVTMYEFAPAPGTRLNKITNLNSEVAMALGALSVRVVAPIPGKSVVGFEVPNQASETVYLKEIIADEAFSRGKPQLALALGKDIDGAPVVVDLARMPHLLVAGTTGSGKSVSVNSMIVSLLYQASPEDVRLIMVDPKMLELSVYEGIPHLLLPVVTDPKKANLALRWATEEMDRRYDLLATMGVRDLATYNRKVARLHADHDARKLERAAEETRRRAEHEEEVEVTEERGQLDLDLDEPPKRLPKIVVIIDEFADLMMCAAKEVETSVARIAQKARAAGIHLILATQRPSVDVITGLIKANFPSRAAFRVSSKVDSRTILDQGGAESLLGSGDMLFSDRGKAVRRVHGCFVDEDEIREIVAFLKRQGKPVYNHDILRPRDDDADAGELDGEADEMYDRAVALVAETRQVSISMIQRRLRVGYNRAARMVEMMERHGVVSPPDGTNRREVLIQPAA